MAEVTPVRIRDRVKNNIKCRIRDGVVGNISPCHGDARGSIPRRGVNFLFFFFFIFVGGEECGLLCPLSSAGRALAF